MQTVQAHVSTLTQAQQIQFAEDALIDIYSTHATAYKNISMHQFAELIVSKQNNKIYNISKLRELTLALAIAYNILTKQQALALKYVAY